MQDWHVARLELVSLLVHDEPCAYVSANLPQMDEVRNVSTRSLDQFESQALARLRAGEDLVTESGPHAIRMLGPILASNDCLKCHGVERGTLLGCFSYTLVPAKAPPAPRRPES